MSPEWISGAATIANALGRLIGWQRQTAKTDAKLDRIISLLEERAAKKQDRPEKKPD
jgi:hypothetical protein